MNNFLKRYTFKISLIFTIAAELPLILMCLLTAIKLYSAVVLISRITTAITGRNVNIYAGKMVASSCNSRKCYFLLMWASLAPDQCLIFPDIRCVVTLYNCPHISH